MDENKAFRVTFDAIIVATDERSAFEAAVKALVAMGPNSVAPPHNNQGKTTKQCIVSEIGL